MTKPLNGKVAALVTGGSRGKLVTFLAGPEAGFITGTTVNIDGGLTA